MHVLVPGAWSVSRAHDAAEELERTLEEEFPDLEVSTHIEPREDPRAYDDVGTYEVPIRPVTNTTEEPP